MVGEMRGRIERTRAMHLMPDTDASDALCACVESWRVAWIRIEAAPQARVVPNWLLPF